MNPDNDLLASAYLDGELTDDERRIAEADPAVMAEVERMRALSERLAAVEPPSSEARERAIAAAMGVFAELRADSAATPPAPPPVVDIGRRRDPMRWLGAAAAVLVIGLLGVVLATGGGGDTDDSASEVADESAEEPASEPADEPAEDPADAVTRDAQDAGGTAADTESELATADVAASEPTEEFAEEPASEPADDAVAPADQDVAGSADATVPTAIVLDPELYLDGYPIDSPAALVVVAHHLLDLIDRSELPPTPNHSCPAPDVLARGTYLDPDDDEVIEVYIAVDTVDRTVSAIDSEQCRVLVATDLEP